MIQTWIFRPRFRGHTKYISGALKTFISVTRNYTQKKKKEKKKKNGPGNTTTITTATEVNGTVYRATITEFLYDKRELNFLDMVCSF